MVDSPVVTTTVKLCAIKRRRAGAVAKATKRRQLRDGSHVALLSKAAKKLRHHAVVIGASRAVPLPDRICQPHWQNSHAAPEQPVASQAVHITPCEHGINAEPAPPGAITPVKNRQGSTRCVAALSNPDLW